MQGREWLYYLLNKSGLSYYINNGVLATSAQPKPLRYTPDGWQTINIGYERSLETWGNNRNFTTAQNFVLDGADIIREVFYTKNIEEVVYLLIQKEELVITDTEYYYFHKYFYKGELDLSTTKDTETKVSINLMEGKVSKAYKAYQSTAFELSPDEVYVKMNGLTFEGTKRYVIIEPSYNHGIGTDVKEMIPMQESTSEGTFFNFYFAAQAGSFSDADFDFIQGENLLTSDKNNGQVVADSKFKVHIKGAIHHPQVNARIGLDVWCETGSGTKTHLMYLFHTTTVAGEIWNFDITSDVVNIPKDEKFYIYTTPNNQSNNQWDWVDGTTLEYLTYDIYKTTFIKGKFARNVFSDLGQKITGTADNTVSTLLDRFKNYVITSGDLVRGIENGKIKTSMDAFRKAFDVIECAGLGIIKNKFYLEYKGEFLKDENVIALGQVKDIIVEPAKDLLGSTFKIGYQPNNSDDVNGKYSFNNTSVYTLPIQRVTTTIERITDYITDPYVIELYRANLDGKTTTDSDTDNSIMVLNVDFDNPQIAETDDAGIPVGVTYYNLKRVTYDTITGIPDNSGVYNIEDLTPARLMQKHLRYLNGLLYGFDGQQILFQTTDKNRELYTDKSGIIYDEDANININVGTDALFKPLYFTVTPETSSEILTLLEDNPNRCFSFIHTNGNTYRGFNIKVGVAANSLDEDTYKLLSVADQDTTTLKNW
jgi:hypothetical protein